MVFRNLAYQKAQIEEMSQFQEAQAKRVEQQIQFDIQKAADLNYQTAGDSQFYAKIKITNFSIEKY